MPAHDLVVIGGGPGGYVAAIRAAQLGLNVACVEKEPQLGGTCLRIGCIPSKALLESSFLYAQAATGLAPFGIKTTGVSLDLPAMQANKQGTVDVLARGVDGLLKKNKVTRYLGTGRITGAGRVAVEGKESVELEAKHIIIATGSEPTRLKGVEWNDRIGTSTEALAYAQVPERLVIIGAGAIGLELGSVWARLGTKVTVVELLPRILPGMDIELATEGLKILSRQGLVFKLETRVQSVRAKGSESVVELQGESLQADRVLVAVGRVPFTTGLGIESVGIKLDERGRIPVDDHLQTSAPNIYAVGDVIRGPMLAHKAEEEGMACAEHIASGAGHVDYDTVPNIVYTEPEFASVGKSEDELRAAGIPYKVGKFPFAANGRARALGHTEGRVKMLAHSQTDRVLGVHIVGPRAGDLIAECATAIAYRASSEDIARTCHAHPTLSEAVREAALAVDRRTIHM